MVSWKWFTATSLNWTLCAMETLYPRLCSLTSCSLIWGYQKQAGLMVNNHVYTFTLKMSHLQNFKHK